MKKALLVLVFSTISFSTALGNGGEPEPLPPGYVVNKDAHLSEGEGRLIEPDATISDFENPHAVVRELVGLVRAYGYRCDSVSHARPLFFKPGFEIQCNNLRYQYQVVDKGGRWVVCLNKCK
ncbi:MAG: hypothetical protein F4X32_07175 [Candidatus Dadabacteria bacterium]|nr:hypothetical protein [Candidatus Dadabacteria bacterium]